MKPLLLAMALMAALAWGGSSIAMPGSASFVDQAQVTGNALSTGTLSAPTGMNATGGSSVSLSWTATTDTYASGHRVFRASSSGGPYSEIAQVTPRTNTSYVDSPGNGTFYYVVRSYFQSWESVNSSQVSATASTNTTFYLHNNPSPPSGHTNSQADLPLNTTAPSATTLYNYDQDRDSTAGRVVLKGGSGDSETDLTKYQNWRSAPLGSNLVISGSVQFTVWSAIKDFGVNKRGVLTAYLRHYNGSTYTQIAAQTLNLANWSGGSSSWVQKTLTFPGVSYTVPAGHRLEVKIVVDPNSGDDMWFAYDTTSYPSRIDLP